MPLVAFHSLAGLMMVLAAEPEPFGFDVTAARPAPALTQRFQQTEGWTGGDVATSIPLGKDRTLWLFGDSFIGKIDAGKRVDARMINNAFAWESLKEEKEPLRFFWDQSGKGPAAALRPEGKDLWYWPGDGALVENKLYLFCKVVRRKAEGEPGFEFDWFANELLRIDNPQEKPTQWKVERCRLPEGKEMPRLGSACFLDGGHLYVYGLFPTSACKPLHQPLAVARIATDKLAALDMKGWRYWCRSADGPRWSERPDDLMPLFNDGASRDERRAHPRNRRTGGGLHPGRYRPRDRPAAGGQTLGTVEPAASSLPCA